MKLTHIKSQTTDIYPRYLFHDSAAMSYTLHYESFSKPTIEFHYAQSQQVDWLDIECLCHTELVQSDIDQVVDVDEKATFLSLSTCTAKYMNYDDRQVLVERLMDINFGNIADLSSIQLFFDLLVDKESFIFPLRKRIIHTETTRISDTFLICLHVLVSEMNDEYLFVYLCKVLQRFINYNFTNMLNYRVVYKVLK
ncbi:hypothetical protein [Piscirickettsia litoralis]|uniref:hypothetical protein n=1 Tax=Piscirickettsia litoralis TaxID=1891921 RepID=UPI001F380EC4|nr:hypothetical protein [Piscirickettsia litoralis]